MAHPSQHFCCPTLQACLFFACFALTPSHTRLVWPAPPTHRYATSKEGEPFRAQIFCSKCSSRCRTSSSSSAGECGTLHVSHPAPSLTPTLGGDLWCVLLYSLCFDLYVEGCCLHLPSCDVVVVGFRTSHNDLAKITHGHSLKSVDSAILFKFSFSWKLPRTDEAISF